MVNQFVAVFIDGEYKTIMLVDANTIEEAEELLKLHGWDTPDSLQPVIITGRKLHTIYNGR